MLTPSDRAEVTRVTQALFEKHPDLRVSVDWLEWDSMHHIPPGVFIPPIYRYEKPLIRLPIHVNHTIEDALAVLLHEAGHYRLWLDNEPKLMRRLKEGRFRTPEDIVHATEIEAWQVARDELAREIGYVWTEKTDLFAHMALQTYGTSWV